MSGGLRHAWDYLGAEVWEPLADYSTKGATAPPDLFSDLCAAVDEFLSPRLAANELAEARNDIENARRRFLSLKGTDFVNESAIVRFLEETHVVIATYEKPGFEDLYSQLLRDALGKFNLRYRLDDPFTLRFLLPGSFTNLYAELQRLNTNNPHLTVLWADFEWAFDQYARSQGDPDLRTSIAKASNYLEGLASATNGKSGSLRKLCDRLSDWPHYKVKEAVKSLYDFCSDYPGIRHGGTRGNQKRQLDRRDSIAINVSLLALATYLGNGLDQGEMLGTGPSGIIRPRKTVSPLQRYGSSTGWFGRLLVKLKLKHA